MTQTHTPASPPSPAIAWCRALQLKLMAALDAAWAILEHSDDPVRVRAARDRAKAVGEIAAMARKVVMLEPASRSAAVKAPAAAAGPSLESLALEPLAAALAPVAAASASPTQAEIARRALDKLKGGRRGRL